MKGIIATIALFISFNAFCCKPANPIAADATMLSGVLNKLRAADVFDNFEILTIKKVSSDYMVRVFNSSEEECIDVLLQPYGTGSCDDITADILNMSPVPSSRCFQE